MTTKSTNTIPVLTDAQGRKVNFSNTVIVMTSNAGSERKENALGFAKTEAEATAEKVRAALGEFLRPEFLSRLDEIIIFRHLTEDYGIAHYAAFSGCSAESEASFKTVARLAKKVDELELPVILVIEGSNHRLAETVRRTTKSRDQRILTFNSLQSVGGDATKTTRYIDVMAQNLETLKAALN